MPLFFLSYPLESAIALLILDMLIWKFVLSEYRFWRFGVRVVIYILYSKILFISGLSPFTIAPWSNDEFRHFIAMILEICWWLFSARTLMLFIDLFLLPQIKQRSHLLHDLLAAFFFLVAIIAAIAYVLGLPVKGLLATSGALAIIVGLALQSTLGDVFSGIVLNTTKPYQLGETILVEGTEGKVIEINWRSTYLLTGVGSSVIIPNSLIAKAKIINLSRPSRVHGIAISIEVTPEARPHTVLEALERAIDGCSELLTTHKASAKIKEANAISFKYEINGYVASMDQKTRVCNLLYDLAYRHLAAVGVQLHNLSLATPALSKSSHRQVLLDGINIFRTLTDEEKIDLSAKMVGHQYQVGQEIITYGEVMDYLLIIDSGVLTVSLAHKDGSQFEVGRMGPREIIGEKGIMTDTPTFAYITALTTAVIYRIDKNDLIPFIQSHAAVGDALSSLLSFREQRLSTLLSGQESLPVAHNNIMKWLNKSVNWLKKKP
ncbi:mechanosensitive ion channel family protein [Aquirhabdus sp.]|uniref:mechanosensitive ion channel family protein n=1 Tax=Aquirhabdus sp. TaxID=2824160 RepID=UPI00396CC8CB